MPNRIDSTLFRTRNIRRDALGNLKPTQVSETFTIPNNADTYGYYKVQLSEIPIRQQDHDDALHNAEISGFTEVTNFTTNSGDVQVNLSNNEFFVDYSLDTSTRGFILFDSSNAGQTVTVDYYGIGSLVRSEEMNYLFDNNAFKKVKLFVTSDTSLSTSTGDSLQGYTLQQDDIIMLAGQNTFSENQTYWVDSSGLIASELVTELETGLTFFVEKGKYENTYINVSGINPLEVEFFNTNFTTSNNTLTSNFTIDNDQLKYVNLIDSSSDIDITIDDTSVDNFPINETVFLFWYNDAGGNTVKFVFSGNQTSKATGLTLSEPFVWVTATYLGNNEWALGGSLT